MIKPGDIVRLRSGGQQMTVESIDVAGRVHCVWFAETSIGSYAMMGHGGSVNYASLPSIGTFHADSLKVL